jgi:SAM-dependent methyltransferase
VVSSSVEIEPLELYAAAMDISDYVAAVAPLARQFVPRIGDLLDVGAGGGQLGRALSEPGRRFCVVEPSPVMLARLAALDPAPEIVAAGWKEAAVEARAFDTVLAATMPACFDEPELFLSRCRSWSRRSVLWVVPAQAGPRGMCFAGCLPVEWHGEDVTPGIDVVLAKLAPPSRPPAIAFIAWTFAAVIADLERLARWLADRLGWAKDDRRRRELLEHLAKQARPVAGGHRLEIPRRSAVCGWGIQ